MRAVAGTHAGIKLRPDHGTVPLRAPPVRQSSPQADPLSHARIGGHHSILFFYKPNYNYN